MEDVTVTETMEFAATSFVTHCTRQDNTPQDQHVLRICLRSASLFSHQLASDVGSIKYDVGLTPLLPFIVHYHIQLARYI